MKKHLLWVVFALLVTICNAQISNMGINYQAQLRDNNGVLIGDSNVVIRIQLVPSQFSTIPVWQEEHNLRTDKYGVVSAVIGKGVKTGGTAANFAAVDFSSADVWIKVELKQGSTYTQISAPEPFQAVPYAKAAGNAAAIPAGTVIAFAGDPTKVPAGWLICDGSAVSKSQYAQLYNAIGNNWGQPTDNTLFNLPDMRGMFLRGVSMGSDEDPDKNSRGFSSLGGNINNAVGSKQLQATKRNGLVLNDPGHFHSIPKYTGAGSGNRLPGENGGSNRVFESWFNNITSTTPSGVTLNNGDNETRPVNVYVLYIIKF